MTTEQETREGSEAVRGTATYDDIEAIIPRLANAWAISPFFARALARVVVQTSRRRVLEFGAGMSSLVLGRALVRNGGGQLTSIEQMPRWCETVYQEVRALPGVDARLVQSDVQATWNRRGVYFGYDAPTSALAERAPFDLVVIDAPQSYYGRDGTLHLCLPHLAPGALLVMDDAQRLGEQRVIRDWLRLYPGISLELLDRSVGRGIAVLRYDGDARERFAPRAVMNSAWRYLRLAPSRRRRRAELAAGIAGADQAPA